MTTKSALNHSVPPIPQTPICTNVHCPRSPPLELPIRPPLNDDQLLQSCFVPLGWLIRDAQRGRRTRLGPLCWLEDFNAYKHDPSRPRRSDPRTNDLPRYFPPLDSRKFPIHQVPNTSDEFFALYFDPEYPGDRIVYNRYREIEEEIWCKRWDQHHGFVPWARQSIGHAAGGRGTLKERLDILEKEWRIFRELIEVTIGRGWKPITEQDDVADRMNDSKAFDPSLDEEHSRFRQALAGQYRPRMSIEERLPIVTLLQHMKIGQPVQPIKQGAMQKTENRRPEVLEGTTSATPIEICESNSDSAMWDTDQDEVTIGHRKEDRNVRGPGLNAKNYISNRRKRIASRKHHMSLRESTMRTRGVSENFNEPGKELMIRQANETSRVEVLDTRSAQQARAQTPQKEKALLTAKREAKRQQRLRKRERIRERRKQAATTEGRDSRRNSGVMFPVEEWDMSLSD